MLEIVDYLMLFVLGSLGAFLAGLLGVGGGIIYIPILDFFLSKIGFTDDALVKAILANSLFTIIFSGALASYKQYRMGNFFPKEILYTALPGIATAVLMTLLIRAGSWYTKSFFNYVFAAMLLIIALRMFLKKPKHVEMNGEVSAKPHHLQLTGLLTGFVTALSGLGGGVLMTPIFTDALHIPIKKASSISNGVIPFLAISVGILSLTGSAPLIVPHMQIGYIVWPVVLPMILATFVFAPLGVRVSQMVTQSILRTTFAVFVSIVFIKLAYEILR